MQPQNLFICNIKTIPDTDSVPNLAGFNNPNVEVRRVKLELYHIGITTGRNSFP